MRFSEFDAHLALTRSSRLAVEATDEELRRQSEEHSNRRAIAWLNRHRGGPRRRLAAHWQGTLISVALMIVLVVDVAIQRVFA